MAKLPDTKMDQTLEAMDEQIVIEYQKKEKPRHYLGASEIGHECWRKLFYSFRNASIKTFDKDENHAAFYNEVKRIKAVEDGHYQEILTVKRLRALPYIELHNTDESKGEDEQIGFEMLLGHFRGHVDGIIRGLIQAPKTWHIFEYKSKEQKFVNKLLKLISEIGEKNALQKWDTEYFNQAQIYMHAFKLLRHYMVVGLPGGRGHETCRTDYNKAIAEGIITKAQVIIFNNDDIPEKLRENREFFQCKWCEYSGICHDGDIPLVHCKTCRYSEPVKNGERFCHYKEQIIDNKELHNDNCLFHVFNQALIPNVNLIEQQEDGCMYQTDSGFRFANVFRSGMPEVRGIIDGIFTSQELYKKVKNIHNLKPEKIEVKEKPVKKAWD